MQLHLLVLQQLYVVPGILWYVHVSNYPVGQCGKFACDWMLFVLQSVWQAFPIILEVIFAMCILVIVAGL